MIHAYREKEGDKSCDQTPSENSAVGRLVPAQCALDPTARKFPFGNHKWLML